MRARDQDKLAGLIAAHLNRRHLAIGAEAFRDQRGMVRVHGPQAVLDMNLIHRDHFNWVKHRRVVHCFSLF